MIAANYRKFPQAMALQLVLVFGRCTWHAARPTQRAARAVRAARGELVKNTAQLVSWKAKAIPTWWKVGKRKAVELAKQVREACGVFVWDLVEIAGPGDPESGANKLIALMAKPRPMHQLFSWPILTKAKYQTWLSIGQREYFWAVEKSLAYRDEVATESAPKWAH